MVQLIVNDGYQDSSVDTVNVFASPRITVPDVTGLTKGQAAMAVKKAGLTVGPATLEYNDTVPERLVIGLDSISGQYFFTAKAQRTQSF